MKKVFLIFFFGSLLLFNSLHAQVAPSIEWQKCLGGSHSEAAYSIQQTSEGEFIIAGWTSSSDGDVTENNSGSVSAWVVKLSAVGELLWQKFLGATWLQTAFCVQQTFDGGFIVAGYGYLGYTVLKLDSDGNLVWQNSFGGSGYDQAQSIQQTTDGGFIVAGFSQSNDVDVSGHHGCSNADSCSDYWVVKLSSTGDIVWQKSLGGSGDDRANSVQQTTDGGFIVAGSSDSNDGDVSGNHGDNDYWIVRLDTIGNIEWQKSFGGGYPDVARSVQQTSDGGFVVTGSAASFNGDVTGNHPCPYSNGCTDYWIIKLDGNGNLMWEKAFGGKGVDDAYSVQQTSDGGFIVAGASVSFDGDVTGHHGGYYDYWVLRLDVNGNLIWEQSYGGGGTDDATSIQQTTDGGFIVAGYSYSNEYDVSGNHGGRDFWIVKLQSDSVTGIAQISKKFISVYPNPVQNQLTIFLGKSATTDFGKTVHVYDLRGRIISLPTSNLIPPNAGQISNSIQLNTGNLSPGFYMLQIINYETGESDIGSFVKAE